jgi:hypothetical protein
MSAIETPMLSDKEIIPDDDYIFSLIGARKVLWQNIMNHVKGNYMNAAGEWNYYNDGKRWLFKMILKKKTIFWIGLFDDTFRVTFWFGDKAGPVINDSSLPENIKSEFMSAKKYGAIRAVSVIMNDSNDVDNVLKLIAIKNQMK